MKKKSLITTLIFCGLFSFSTFSASAQEQGSLSVQLEGIKSNKGNVMIALSESVNPMDMKFKATDMAPSDSTGMKFNFEIPAGTVHVCVFHSEDPDFIKNMQSGNMSIPKGGFGYLGDMPGPPPAVEVKEGENKEIKMKMFYF